jgi:ribosomal protein L7/L12
MRVILENVELFTEVSNNATPRDVKDFVDSCRGAVKIVTRHVSMEDAQKAYQLLTQAGAKAEVWACRS